MILDPARVDALPPCCARRGTSWLGSACVALALPKLCCLAPIALASVPALRRSLELTGTLETLRALDALCRFTPGTLAAAANAVPSATALAAFAVGVMLLLWRTRPNTRGRWLSLPFRARTQP